METDIAFAVDADVDARELSRGQSASTSADRQRAQPISEETPLLPETSTGPTTVPGAGLRDDVIDPSLDQPWLGSKEFEDKPRWRRPSIWWLIPPLFLFTSAFGGIVVPRLNLILNLVCRDYLADQAVKDPGFTYLPVIFGEDNDQCRTPEVQSLAAMFMLYMNLASGILSAIVSPRLGHLSDRYGRKTLMALSSICTLVGEAVAIIVASRPESSSAYLLLVAAFIDGLGGSFTSSIALVHSYASDCTPPERRNVVFGYFHATIFSGIALGPFLFGLMIKLTGSVLAVFYTVAGCHLFYFMIIAFAIPESVSKDRQRAARERHRVKHLGKQGGLSWSSVKDLNPINIVRPLSILFPKFEHSQLWSSERRKTLGHLRRNLILLASIDTLMFGVTMGTMPIVLLYAEYMFGWLNYESSIFLSVTSTGRVIILLIVFPIITRLTRGPQRTEQTNSGSDRLDIGVIQLSIIFDLAGYIGYCLAGSGGVFLLSAVVSSVSGMGSPTLQSSLTKHVPPSHTGQILGATGLLHALARVVSPVIFNVIYSSTVHKFPQTVFVCLASVFGLAFVLSLFMIPNVYLPPTPPPGRPGETVEEDEETPLAA